MLVRSTSPAPRSTASTAHSRASRSVGCVAETPWTCQPSPERAASMATTTDCDPSFAAIRPMSSGSRNGALLRLTLSAPASSRAAASSYVGNPTADGERHVERGGGTADEVEHRGASVPRGGDVEDDDLVGAVGRVPGGELDRIARVAEIHEARSLHDAAVSNVEAGEQAFRERHPQVTPARASPAAIAPPRVERAVHECQADHRSIDARRCQRPQLDPPRRSRRRRQARPGECPPHFARRSMFGPLRVPSRDISVTI